MSTTAELDTVLNLLVTGGTEQYGHESVNQLTHALQAAAIAEASGASPALITAALLHDIGHLTDPEFEPALQRGEDRWHEDLGADYLAGLFGPDVTEPVRLHVPAKRYLCAVDPDYAARLSPTSVKTLGLQGGALRCRGRPGVYCPPACARSRARAPLGRHGERPGHADTESGALPPLRAGGT